MYVSRLLRRMESGIYSQRARIKGTRVDGETIPGHPAAAGQEPVFVTDPSDENEIAIGLEDALRRPDVHRERAIRARSRAERLPDWPHINGVVFVELNERDEHARRGASIGMDHFPRYGNPQ